MFSTLRNYGDTDLVSAIQGASVYGVSDEKLGTVEDVIIDEQSGDPTYLVVDAGWLSTREFLIPVQQVFDYGDSDDFYVNLTKEEVKTLPKFDRKWLASSSEFAQYDAEYRRAWRFSAPAKGYRVSRRVAAFRDKLRSALAKRPTTSTATTGTAARTGNLAASRTGNLAAYGLYRQRSDVDVAVTKLRDLGFENNEISVLFPDRDAGKEFAIERGTKAPEGALAGGGTGLAVGGALGWLAGIGALTIPGLGPFIAAGPIFAAITGAGVGSAIGGIAGALFGLGVPELEAKRYESELKQGGILLSVHCTDTRFADSAQRVLQETGARDIFATGYPKAA
jgi:sporulation protein YlmC with PRC-barrel domain